MKKHCLFTICLIFLSLLIKAQDTLKQHARPDSIIKFVPIFDAGRTYNAFTIGGKIETAKNVRSRLLAYPPSAMEVHKTLTDVTWSYISLAGFGASTSVAIVKFAHHSEQNLNNSAQAGFVNGQPGFIYPTQRHYSLTGAYIFTGVAAVFLAATIYHFIKSAKHGQKALKLYNQRFE